MKMLGRHAHPVCLVLWLLLSLSSAQVHATAWFATSGNHTINSNGSTWHAPSLNAKGWPTAATKTILAQLAKVTVLFAEPAWSGDSVISGCTVVSNSASSADSNAGSTGASHRAVTGLTNGMAYTPTVTASNILSVKRQTGLVMP